MPPGPVLSLSLGSIFFSLRFIDFSGKILVDGLLRFVLMTSFFFLRQRQKTRIPVCENDCNLI